ncbi:MAG: Na+/H+ antiporter subunit G [Lysobacteraceae bacterium]
MTSHDVFEILFVFLLAAGVFFSLVGSLGLLKLSEFMRRLHGPTKATTLGVGSVLIAAMLHHVFLGPGLGVRELLITLFLFMGAPVSAKMLGKAALISDPAIRELPVPRPLDDEPPPTTRAD